MRRLLRRRPVRAVVTMGTGLALATSLSACTGVTTLQSVVGNVGPSFTPMGAPPTLQVGFRVLDAPPNQPFVCVVQIHQGTALAGTALVTDTPPPGMPAIVELAWVTVPASAMQATAQDASVNCVTAATTRSGAGPPSSTDCHSGSFSLVVSLTGRQSSVCLHQGTTLTVTSDKSAGGLGVPGPWTIPPLDVVDSSVLRLSSSSESGPLLKAVLETGTPGTTSVSAHFDEECSSGDTTACTIPPQGVINLNVTVVAP
jgi:hypothetical protein